MSAHSAWPLMCRMFAGGTPRLRAVMPPRDAAILPVLGRAVKSVTPDARFMLCPYCREHGGEVFGDGRGGRTCHCPECGPVEVTADDMAMVALDEDWLRTKLRAALGVGEQDGIDDLGDDVWRLGDARSAPVLLARRLDRLWSEPALLDRVRVPGGSLRVVTPKPRKTRGAPFGPGVEWLALEDRFAWSGDSIAFLGAPGVPTAAHPADPVHGPFSADFKWVTLPGEAKPIGCRDGQAAVFRVLWSFEGRACTAEQIMRGAGLASPKPVDVFKGDNYVDAARAYRALVVTQRRQGLYSLPCAKEVRP